MNGDFSFYLSFLVVWWCGDVLLYALRRRLHFSGHRDRQHVCHGALALVGHRSQLRPVLLAHLFLFLLVALPFLFLLLLLLLLLLLRQRDRCCPKCLGSSEGYCGGSNAPRDARKMP